MNREIKFRCLDDTVWLYSDELGMADFWKTIEIAKYPVMQFTGLLDKDGKEIYEGDVIKYCRNIPMVFLTERGQMNAKGLDYNEGVGEVKYISSMFTIDGKLLGGHHYDPEEFEVVGNIYENPDLLKPND